MGIVLGDNRYGKAEVRLVRVDRGAQHQIVDLNVSTALARSLRIHASSASRSPALKRLKNQTRLP